MVATAGGWIGLALFIHTDCRGDLWASILYLYGNPMIWQLVLNIDSVRTSKSGDDCKTNFLLMIISLDLKVTMLRLTTWFKVVHDTL